ESIRGSSQTEIFYEAPHRLKETIGDIVAVLGQARPIVVARELTKIHEEFLRGSAGQVLQQLNSRGEIKGEITLLIDKASEEANATHHQESVRERVQEIMAEQNLDEKAALKVVAKERGISKSEAYRELQRSK